MFVRRYRVINFNRENFRVCVVRQRAIKTDGLPIQSCKGGGSVAED